MFQRTNLIVKFDYVVDLDVTAPLRLKIDIIKAFNKIHKNKFATNLVSGCNSKKNPFFNQVEFSNNILKLVKSSKKKLLEDRILQGYMILMHLFIYGEENIY